MASIKDLKKRIGTVKNTQQTTRAMKMVSAAKLRRAQEAILAQRPYAKKMGELIRLVASLSDSPTQSPLIRREDVLASDRAEKGAKKKLLLLVVTSDRGLCGAFNSNVIKTAQRWAQAHANEYESIEWSFVGRKGFEFFRARKVPALEYYSQLGGKVTFAKARNLAQSLTETYLSGRVDEVRVVYNEFKNAVTQKVVIEGFLPIEGSGPAEEKAAPATNSDGLVYLVKPSQPELLEQLLAKNFEVQAFRFMLESQAGEHGARMSSMENATKNAGEMIRKLTLQYNKQRQAGITKELLEIISGSESQKG